MSQHVLPIPGIFSQRRREHEAEYHAGQGDRDSQNVFNQIPNILDGLIAQQQHRPHGANQRDGDIGLNSEIHKYPAAAHKGMRAGNRAEDDADGDRDDDHTFEK